MSDAVLSERVGDVLVLTLNRPEVLNAWSTEMESTVFAQLEAADADPGIRAICVTGAGRAFCAGADLSGPVDELPETPPLPVRRAEVFPPTMATPVIAAINGACAGVGLAFALQADVRFVAADAKLTTAFARRGLVAEHGVAWLLPRLVGRGRALDLLLSGRVFSGADAVAYGLAEFVSSAEEVLSRAMDYAAELAETCSPRAMARIKDQLWRDDARDPLEAVTRSDHHVRESFTWPDVREGISSWQDRRAPRFPGWPARDV